MTATIPLWRVTGTVRVLAAGSLLSSVAFFAAMPFGALYLDEYTGLGTATIGAVVGSVSLIGALGGFLGGTLVDRLGALPTMQAGLVLTVLSYVLFTAVRAEAGIIALFMLLGVGRLLVEPASKHLMSTADDGDGRIFRVRYMTLCAGAIVGPLLGGVLYHVSVTAFFAVPAVFYAAFLALLSAHRAALTRPAATADGTGTTTWQGLGAAVRDRRLWAPVLAGTVVFFVFSQLEAVVPLLIRGEVDAGAAQLFSWLLIANAVLALGLQPVVDAVSRRVPHRGLVLIGALGFVGAFGCFALMGEHVGWLFAGIVCWTVGEAVLLPMPDIAVHRLAPEESKGAYFGLSELRYLGFFLGPLAGGLLIAGQPAGGATVTAGWLVVMGLAAVLTVPLLLGRRHTDAQPTTGTPPATATLPTDRQMEPDHV